MTLPAGEAAGLARRGTALRREGRAAEAQACFEQALQHDRACVPAWVNLAAVQLDQGRPGAAEAAALQALSLAPDAADAHFNLGCAQLALGRHAEALASFAAVPPGHAAAAAAALNAALAWRARCEPSHALVCCDAGLAEAGAEPGLHADLHLQRALALLALNRPADADAAAQAVLQARPGDPHGLLLRGRALLCRGQAAAARQQIDLALAAAPTLALAWHDRGHASLAAGALEEACADYGRAMTLAPRTPWLAGQWLHTRLKCADWQQLDVTVAQLVAGVQAGQPLATPFQLSLLPVPAATLRQAAELTMQHLVPRVRAAPPAAPALASPPRLRVAYVSADWHDHPTLDLLLPVLELHDRARFELIGVALAPPAEHPQVRRAAAILSQFVDVHALGDDEAAARLRALGLHIALDLNIFTQGARPGLFAGRIAPLQLALLGYPGTGGGVCHDYLVADAHVVPADARAEIAEALLMLPDSYFPGHLRPPADTPARAELGLPPQGFVFCCMNHPAKILPASFGLWMRLLREVPGSVLWLRDPFGAAAPRLRQAAAALGVAPQRLVFAPQRPRDDYLAALGAADLFLDTWPYNAHTTGLEALRAGLPVLTLAGQAFAGRVGTSLLHAAGLPQLVASTPAEYEARALQLAREPAQLTRLRNRLAEQRDSAALFDTARWVRHLELGFEAVWQRHCDGRPPGDVHVPAAPPSQRCGHS